MYPILERVISTGKEFRKDLLNFLLDFHRLNKLSGNLRGVVLILVLTFEIIKIHLQMIIKVLFKPNIIKKKINLILVEF